MRAGPPGVLLVLQLVWTGAKSQPLTCAPASTATRDRAIPHSKPKRNIEPPLSARRRFYQLGCRNVGRLGRPNHPTALLRFFLLYFFLDRGRGLGGFDVHGDVDVIAQQRAAVVE